MVSPSYNQTKNNDRNRNEGINENNIPKGRRNLEMNCIEFQSKDRERTSKCIKSPVLSLQTLKHRFIVDIIYARHEIPKCEAS